MNYVIEYVKSNGIISKIQFLQRNYRNAMDAMDANFNDIKEFIGEGHVETVSVHRDHLFLVHDNGLLIGMTPNLRPDIYHLLGSVVIIKPIDELLIPEIIGTG